MIIGSTFGIVANVDDLLPAGCLCSRCEWEGLTKDCDSEMWGDWSMDNTYIIDFCPKCGSVIEDYFHPEEE